MDATSTTLNGVEHEVVARRGLTAVAFCGTEFLPVSEAPSVDRDLANRVVRCERCEVPYRDPLGR